MTFNWTSLISKSYNNLTTSVSEPPHVLKFYSIVKHETKKKQQHDFEVRCLSVTGSCSHHSYNMAQRIIHEATLISNSTKVENLTIFGKNEVWMKEKCAEGRWDLSFNLRPRVKRSFTAVVLLSELLWTWYTCVV